MFAALPIPKGTRIIEYRGMRTDWDEALSRPDSDPDNPFHTFFFELDDGRVITETRAICTLLEGRYPEPNLMGEGDERGFILFPAVDSA